MTTFSSRRPGDSGRADRPSPREAGFTLYEIIIVLVVLLVVAGLVAPSFAGFLPSFRIRKAGEDLIAAVEKARVDAVLTSRRFRLVFSKEPAAYRLEYEPDPMNEPATFRRLPGEWGAKNELPDGVAFSSLDGAAEVPEALAGVFEECLEFSPDGSASAMTIVLALENGETVTIEVNPADGRARVVEPAEGKP
jgi:prepilin-type N-terminal cleavage/methylation domain-containing protein